MRIGANCERVFSATCSNLYNTHSRVFGVSSTVYKFVALILLSLNDYQFLIHNFFLLFLLFWYKSQWKRYTSSLFWKSQQIVTVCGDDVQLIYQFYVRYSGYVCAKVTRNIQTSRIGFSCAFNTYHEMLRNLWLKKKRNKKNIMMEKLKAKNTEKIKQNKKNGMHVKWTEW